MGTETNAPEGGATSAASGADFTALDVTAAPSETPAVSTASPDFVRAVSDFLDTDPTDLLRELGYYDRDDKR